MTSNDLTSPTAPAARTHPRLADDAIIAFRPGTVTLAEGDATWLRRWVGTWYARSPDALVVMGCVGLRSRSARVAGLRHVRDAVAARGVAPDRIRTTSDALHGAFMPGTAWLKVIRAHDGGLDGQPVRSFFAPSDKGDGEPPCTSAS